MGTIMIDERQKEIKYYSPYGNNCLYWRCENVNESISKIKMVQNSSSKESKEFLNSDFFSENSNTKTSSDYYFNSYEHHSIHEDMLKDTVRTGAYYHSIVSQSHVFKDKIVIDVGAGTGILSMFAAKAGAKKVIAIEKSSMVSKAREIVSLNGFGEVITFIEEKAEHSDDLIDEIGQAMGFSKGEKFVDFIISEWMGYCLLYESMLDSVIHVRDKFMKPSGSMFPDKAVLHIAGLKDSGYKKESHEFWKDIMAFDLSPMKELAETEGIVDWVSQENITTDSCAILELDLNTCKVSDCDFVSEFLIVSDKDSATDALVLWFDIGFGGSHRTVVFSTSPFSVYTHWKQTIFYLPKTILPKEKEIRGMFALRKNAKNPRDLDIKIKLTECEELGDDLHFRVC